MKVKYSAPRGTEPNHSRDGDGNDLVNVLEIS